MQNKSLKQQTFNGIGWSSIERFSTQGVSFVVQLILARLLTPSDYGIIGMLAIFMQLAQVIIDSGFANALIRKQNCTQRDYSTVFFYNLILSLGTSFAARRSLGKVFSNTYPNFGYAMADNNITIQCFINYS